MKKNSKNKTASVTRVDPYLEGFMAKLLDRFAALERKVDTVIAGMPARSSGPDPRAVFEQNLQAKERNARRERVMFEAVCADCNAPCEVPFRPSEGRAIYCRECWAKRRSGGSGPNPIQNLSPKPASPAPVKKQPAKKPKKKK